jgi:Contractile injection system tube protein/LysM domain
MVDQATKVLAKLQITPHKQPPKTKDPKNQSKPLIPLLDQIITVMFNPESYSISKSVTWGPPAPKGTDNKKEQTALKFNAPIIEFSGGASRQLSLELFFDVSDQATGNPDVRTETNKIAALTRITRGEQGNEESPAICKLSWGKAPKESDFPFCGVITSLAQKFTLFSGGGNPLRATLSITFLEFLDPEADTRQTDPELTSHLVRRGETLSTIALKVYGDQTQWRSIAMVNRLSNPRDLEPWIGQRLIIPKPN